MLLSKLRKGNDAALGIVLPWILRLGVSGCYIGHGAFGIITKAAWVPYFGVAGITEPTAWRLMPWVGMMDIAMGILVLVWPCRALFAWAVVWTAWTALLRPLSGEPFWEALERAGNYGVPLAVMMVVGFGGPLFARFSTTWRSIDDTARERLAWTLRLTILLLLVGHAGLGLFEHKAGLARHYAALNFSNPSQLVPLIGAFEFLLAGVFLLVPRPGLVLFICGWKLATESLFLLAGAPVWELVERAGSYAAPLALAFLLLRQMSDEPILPPAIRSA